MTPLRLCARCCSAATAIPGPASTAMSMPSSAGILLEVMRDLLYQTFVRKARLLQAMTFRRFVAPASGGGRLDAEIRAAGASWLAHEHPRVAEQAHPAAVFRPFLRRPGMLHACGTRARDAASCEVTRPSALHSPASPRAEPFGLQGYFSVGRSRCIHVLQRHQTLRQQARGARRLHRTPPDPRRAPPRSAAPNRACRPTAPTATAARAPAPGAPRIVRIDCARTAASLRPGNQFLERGEHLAAVAHAQGECGVAGEESRQIPRAPAN